jgi:hypothetical protein
VLAILKYPHVLDSSQLAWTKNLLILESSASVIPTANNTGALGYSALIAPIAVLFPGIPLATLASGFKPFLGLLLALAAILVVDGASFKRPAVYKTAYFSLIMLSFFGLYGVLELGKDSSFGVVLSLIYIASLQESQTDRYSLVDKGIFLSVAVSCGMITIPYLLVITLLYILFKVSDFPIFKFIYIVLAFALVPLTAACSSMMHIGWAPISVSLGAICATAFVLRKRELRIALFESGPWRYLPAAAFLALLALCYVMMPAKADIVAWINLDGSPLVVSRPPLDGETSFTQFLFSFDRHLPKYLVIGAMIGMLATLLPRKRARSSCIKALSLFPFIVIASVLVFARMEHSPFSGFNLWDMIRDIPLWYGGIVFGLFCLLLIDDLEEGFVGAWKLPFVAIALLALVGMHKYNARAVVRSLTSKTFYSSVIGHRFEYFVKLMDKLQRYELPVQLYIAPGSLAENMFFAYQMYGKDIRVLKFDPHDSAALKKIAAGRQKNVVTLLAMKTAESVEVDATFLGAPAIVDDAYIKKFRETVVDVTE